MIFTVVGIVLCVILIPILIMNCILLVKGYTNEDEVPSIGGTYPLIVLTDSMADVFNGGDLIFAKSIAAEDVQVGDVISFFDPASSKNAVLTHRVIEITTDEEGGLAFKTKGDANNAEDKELVPAANVFGKYADFHIDNAGDVAMFMQTTAGLIVCVIVPLILFVGYDIIRRNIYNKKHDSEKDALMSELEELRKLKAETAGAAAEAPAPAEASSEEDATV